MVMVLIYYSWAMEEPIIKDIVFDLITYETLKFLNYIIIIIHRTIYVLGVGSVIQSYFYSFLFESHL